MYATEIRTKASELNVDLTGLNFTRKDDKEKAIAMIEDAQAEREKALDCLDPVDGESSPQTFEQYRAVLSTPAFIMSYRGVQIEIFDKENFNIPELRTKFFDMVNPIIAWRSSCRHVNKILDDRNGVETVDNFTDCYYYPDSLLNSFLTKESLDECLRRNNHLVTEEDLINF